MIGIKKSLFGKKLIFVLLVILIPTFVLVSYLVYQKQVNFLESNGELTGENLRLKIEVSQLHEKISSVSAEINRLNNEDLRKANTQVRKELVDLKNIYKATLLAYEDILFLGEHGVKITSKQVKFSLVLSFLAKDDIPGAQKTLKDLNDEISKEKISLASIGSSAISSDAPVINSAPSTGYRRQKVEVGGVSFLVDFVAADLNTTRVIVDTASDGTCGNNCPVLPLSTYVSRSGAYAGINGTYFCPETYPSCADKKNAFDTLLMNKNKVYFNSDNNVYSTVPVAVFSGSSARFLGQSSGWGRDTGVDSVIANRPLLVLDGNLMFGSGGEEKEAARSNRSFLGASGNVGYIGVVRNASVAESAKVLHAMGVKSAINLDAGGSTALWSGGYKVGPGRNLPNVVLFVRK